MKSLHTPDCGLGLFATEDINKNEYIIEYTGNITSKKSARKNDYLAMVKYRDKNGTYRTFYINGENSPSLVRKSHRLFL